MLIAAAVMILADGRRLQRLCEEEVRETLPLTMIMISREVRVG